MRKIFDKNGTNGIAGDYLGGAQVLPDALIVGRDYMIKTVGNTDWASVGATSTAADNMFFTCTAVGASGTTGKARNADGMTIRMQKLRQKNSANTTDSTAWPQYRRWKDGREVTSTRDELMDTVAGFKNHFVDDGNNITTYKMWEEPMLRATVSLHEDTITNTNVHITNAVINYPEPHGYVDGDIIVLTGFDKSWAAVDDRNWYAKVMDDDTIQLSYNKALTDMVGFDTTWRYNTYIDVYNYTGNEFNGGVAVGLKDHEFVSDGDAVTITNATKNGGDIEDTLYYIKTTPWNSKRAFLYHDQALTNLVDVSTLTWETGYVFPTSMEPKLGYHSDGTMNFNRRLKENELTITNTTAVEDADSNILLAANTIYYLEYIDSMVVDFPTALVDGSTEFTTSTTSFMAAALKAFIYDPYTVYEYGVYSDIERTTRVDFAVGTSLGYGVFDTSKSPIELVYTPGLGDQTTINIIDVAHNGSNLEGDTLYLNGTSVAGVYELYKDIDLTNSLELPDLTTHNFKATVLIHFNWTSTGYETSIEYSTYDPEFEAVDTHNYLHNVLEGNNPVLFLESDESDTDTHSVDVGTLYPLYDTRTDNANVAAAGFLTDNTSYYMNDNKLYTDSDHTSLISNSNFPNQLMLTGNYDPRILLGYARVEDEIDTMDGYPPLYSSFTTSTGGTVNLINDLVDAPGVDDIGDSLFGPLMVRPAAGYGWYGWASTNKTAAILDNDPHKNFVTLTKRHWPDHETDPLRPAEYTYGYGPFNDQLGFPMYSIFNDLVHLDVIDLQADRIEDSYDIITTDTNYEINTLYKFKIGSDAYKELYLPELTPGMHLNYNGIHHSKRSDIFGIKTNATGSYLNGNSPWIFLEIHFYDETDLPAGFPLRGWNTELWHQNPYALLGEADNTTQLLWHDGNAPSAFVHHDDDENEILHDYLYSELTQPTLLGFENPVKVEYERSEIQTKQGIFTLDDFAFTIPKYKANKKQLTTPDTINGVPENADYVLGSSDTGYQIIEEMGTPFIYIPETTGWCGSNILDYKCISTTRTDNSGNDYEIINTNTEYREHEGEFRQTGFFWNGNNNESSLGHSMSLDASFDVDEHDNLTHDFEIYPRYAVDPNQSTTINIMNEGRDPWDYETYFKSSPDLVLQKVTIDGDDFYLVPANQHDYQVGQYDHGIENSFNMQYYIGQDQTLHTAQVRLDRYMLLPIDQFTVGEDLDNVDYYYWWNESPRTYNLYKMLTVARNAGTFTYFSQYDNGVLVEGQHSVLLKKPTTITFQDEHINDGVSHDSLGWIDLDPADQIPLDIGYTAMLREHKLDEALISTTATSADPLLLAPCDPGKVDTAMTYYPATQGITYLRDFAYKIDSIQMVSPGNKQYSYLDSSNATIMAAQIHQAKYWKKNDGSINKLHGGVTPDIDVTVNSNGYVTGATLNSSTDTARFKYKKDILLPIVDLDDQYTTPALTTSALEDVWDTNDEWTDQGYDKTKLWPAHIAPASAEVTINQPSSTTISQAGTKYVRSAGFTKWEISLDYPPMSKDDFAPFNAVVQAVRGQYTPLYLKLKYNGSNILFNFGADSSTNKPRVAAAYEDDNKVVLVDGFESNEANVFKKGEVIITGQDNGSLQTVLNDVDSNAFGEAKIRLAYPSDISKTVGNRIYKDPFWAIVTLTDNNFTYTVDTAGFYRIRVKFTLDDWK